MQRTAVGWLQENPASHEEEKEGEHDTLHDSRPLHWQEDARVPIVLRMRRAKVHNQRRKFIVGRIVIYYSVGVIHKVGLQYNHNVNDGDIRLEQDKHERYISGYK